MATLWNKGTSATERVENFTVGNDRQLDLRLAAYDIEGSKAHIKMLRSIGLLSQSELDSLISALDKIEESVRDGSFVLEDDVEDIHSQIELSLTRELGDRGKKIHSGRSRNDQVLVDIKLFLRDELLKMREETLTLFRTLQSLSEKYKEVLLPGYTHFQLAMPSSFGMWFGAYAEALVDDMHMLHGAYRVTNRNPLGSAAGYGNSFPLDRDMTTRLLGFDSPVINSIAAQMSRGRTERCVASAMGSLSLSLNTIMECVDKIRDTATSHDRIFFVEVMGRDAGFLTQNSAIASGAEAAIIPEDNTDIDQLATFIGRGIRKSKNSSIVLVSEKDGGAMHYAERVRKEYPEYDVRVSILGHLQRGGTPTAYDRILASRLGVASIEALKEGQRNVMVGIKNDQIVYVPISRAIKMDKPIDRELINVLSILSI